MTESKVYIVYVEHETLDMPVIEVYDSLRAADEAIDEIRDQHSDIEKYKVTPRQVHKSRTV